MANKIDYEVGFKVNQAGLKQLKTSLQELQSMKYSDLIKINDSDISSARAALGEIQREAANVEKALDKAFNAKLNTVNIQTFNQTLVAQKSNIQQVYNAFSKAGATGQAAFRNLSTQLLSTNVQLKESHALLDKMATTLGNTIKWNLASGAVNSLSRSVEQAWGYVKSLDTSLNDIRIVTGKSADEMAKFAVQANNAAKELGKTTTDYTNASLIYAQQGLNDQEIAARAAITLKAANVTGQSTDEVSEQLTAVWNGYKVTADEAELYVDRLAAIAATTASDLEELSTGMSKVASAAAAMGVGEEQLAAQLSTIISVTKQAPESVGTALRTVYARISDIKAGIDEDGVTLGNYSGKMADLGFNVLDATGHLRDMGEVMEEIGGRWQDLTREQQISLAQTMAGQRQYSNLIALFDNFEQYTEALNTAQNAAGTLQEQQDIYMESTKAHLATLKASVENIYDSLIDSNAKDGINDLVDGLSTAADAVASLVDSIGGGEGVLKALGAIGFSVFSDQIANSIQITIGNLQRARTQAEEFRDAIKMAQEIQNKNLGNQYTQFMVGRQESLLKVGGELDPQQYSAIQNDLKQLSQNAGELEKTNEKIDLIKKGMEKAQIDLDEFVLKYGSFDQMLANPQGLETVVESLKAFKDGMQTATESQEKMIKAFKDFGSAGTEETFNALRDSMKSFVSDLRDFSSSSKDDLSAAFDLLPQGLRKTVQEASASLEILDFNVEGSSGKIKDVFANLNGAFTQQLSSINKLIAEGGDGQLQSLESRAKAIQAIIDQLKKRTDQALKNAEKTIDIRNITRTVAGINSMAVAIRQVQNLGSIWKNEDLSKGQKVLQTVLNLSMSLPMFFSGLTKVGKAMGLFQVVIGKEAAASFAAVAANDAHAKSILGLKIATDGTTKAFQFFNVAILANPMIAFAAAAGVAAAALGILVKRADKAREATIEANKAEIDSINQKQATRQANKELWKSLDELDQKYKNGEISRSELKSSTQELISQYQLEENQVKSLTSSYNDLSTAINTMHEKDAEANLESAKRESRLAANNVVQTMHGQQEFFDRISNKEQYQLSLNKGWKSSDQSDAFIDALLGAKGASGTKEVGVHFVTDASAESIVELYDYISKVVEDSNQYMTSIEQQNSQYYRGAVEWLKKMRDSAEAYKAALQDVETYTTDFTAALAQNQGKIDFGSITDVDTYLAQRNNLIEALNAQFQKEGVEKTEEELNSLVDSYLLANYSQIYNKYAEVNDLIQSIAKDAGEVPDSIKKALSGLNQQQLDYISKIAPNIKDWDTFETILEKVSKIDFSNMAVINNDIEALYNQASDTYNKYQSLEQQVKGGKSISTIESLDPEIQGFFSRMANGTYKMTADAKTFYNTVNDLKLDGFYKTLGAVNSELEKVSSLRSLVQNSDFDYQNYNKSAVTQRQGTRLFDLQGDTSSPNTVPPPIDYQIVKQQLEYLDAVNQTDEALKANVSTWKDLVQHQSLGVEQAKKIYEAYEQAGDQTEHLDESRKILLEDQIALYHQLHDAMFPTDEDVDTGALQALSETISDMAENSTELDQHLTEDARAAQDVAEAILRFDDAVTDVVDNYEDWIKVLNNGSESEKAEIVEDLRDAYADLLDLDGSSLSNEFLTSADNLNLMKAAIDGDIESYDELMSLAGQDIIAHLSLDKEQFNADLTAVQNQLDALNFQDLEIGASLNTEGFLQACQNLVQNAGMTAQQATDYLASMGVDAEVIEQKATTTETKENTGWHAQPHELPLPYEIPFGNGLSVGFQSGAGLITTPTYVPDTQTVVDTKQSSNFALKVVSAHKSSGGNFKFTQAPNGGGSKGQARRSTPSKGGKGGGGGKKGGGGKAAKPDTSKKDLKKSLEDERDIYHDINIELEQIDRNLDRAQKKQDRLYGKQLLDNLNEQSRILEQHKQTLKEKQKLQEEDLKQQRKTLKNLGVTFDKYGDISNYMSVLGKKQAEVNALIAEENSMIEAYNKQTDADVKKAIAEQIAEQQKKVKAAQDEYKDLQNRIKNYDETMKGLQDTLDQITEDAQKQVEINIQKFKMEVEIRLDMGQAERDWNKFRRQVLEHTDIIRDTDFHEIFNDALQNANDVTSYFDVHGSKGSIQMLMEQALRTREQIEQINKTGTSEVYGDNKAQAMEDLQNYLNELMGQMEDVKKLINDIDKAYLETIDDVEKQFDKQIEDYEFIGELIEHDMDLLSLLYGDKNYDAMNRYYETLEENNLKQLDSLKQQRDFWKQQWDAAMAAGDIQAAKQFEQRYRETIKNLNSLIEDSAKTIQDKYTNAINKIFDELDKKLTNGKGIDYLNTEWELMNKNADEYLDTINSAFAIQETERKYQQALNDTKSIKNQQALKNLMDEQLNILKNKEKITQYDIDRAEKLLQVEQARIALEDAQSAKTSMRLKRDSQGNYSYEFAADEGAIGDAQANLAAAQNDLYNFDKDAYKKNLDDMLSAYQDFVERSKQLSLAAAQGDAEAQEKLVLLREQFGEYINGKTEQNLTIRTNLTDSALKDLALLYDKNVENYQNMSDGEKKILMEDLIPAWDGGIQKMIDKVAGEGGFIPAVEQSFNKVDKATKDYQQELDKLADAAGISLGDVKGGVDLLANAFGVLVQANDDLIGRMGEELTAVQLLREQAQGLVSAYGAVYAAAAQAVTELHNFVQAEQGAAAAYAQTAAAYESMVHRIQQANADYAAHPYGGGYTPPSGGGNNDNDNSGGGTDNNGDGTDNSGDQDLLKKNRRGNRGCFAAGTKIIMADQLVKNIEDIQVGDLVIAYNDETCTYEPRKVTKTFIHQNMPELVNIILSNGIILKITPGHPILTTEGWKSLDIENSWYEHGVQVTLLKINDEILGYNGNTFVSEIYYLPFSNYTVYNLEVETCHTFLADGIVVHNIKVNDPIRLASGGYTGDWSSSEGKIAILHEKQQVFNEDDTQKLLEAVQILREITFNSSVSLKNRMSQLSVRSMVATNSSPSAEELQQTVSISATFPNVNSKREIEEALSDLVNLAAQRRMRRG